MDIKSENKNKISKVLDNFILQIGKFVSWANGILVLVIVLQVTLRYGFGRGLVLLEELEWHLYSLAFMFGLSYALVTNAHVRVDILHNLFSKRTKEWIEAIGTFFVLMPFIIAILIFGIEFFQDSWVHNESSSAPLGLPFTWAIKSVIPISFVMLAIAAISRLIHAFIIIKGGEEDGVK